MGGLPPAGTAKVRSSPITAARAVAAALPHARQPPLPAAMSRVATPEGITFTSRRASIGPTARSDAWPQREWDGERVCLLGGWRACPVKYVAM
jgi:hypothetical protein